MADVGSTWVFAFDAKMGDLTGASTALAFIKTLDPNAAWALTNATYYEASVRQLTRRMRGRSLPMPDIPDVRAVT